MTIRRGRKRSVSEAANRILPAGYRAAAVVTACNEEELLPLVLRELAKLPLEETIVVLNGCTDNSLAAAQACPGVTIVHYADRLGHDVGRAIGAKLSSADGILFVDGDLPIPAERLKLFLAAVANGVEVALNDITPYLPRFRDWDDVTRLKSFLNLSLRRPDLRANSLTSIPHAISRQALDKIGTSVLAVPPMAQAAAIEAGLHIRTAASIDVFRTNRLRECNVGNNNETARLIIGDHIEALKHAMGHGGNRLGGSDANRRRNAIRWGVKR